MEEVRDELSLYPESKVYLSSPAVIPGLGTSGGFEMVLEARGDRTYTDLQQAVDTLMYYAERRPELAGLSSSMQSDIPQLYYDVDRDKAQLLGVSMSDVFSTLKTFKVRSMSTTSTCSTVSTASTFRPRRPTVRTRAISTSSMCAATAVR